MGARGDRRAVPTRDLVVLPRFHAREYLKINPLFETIPLLVDGETRMTVSAAICQYLAERHAGPPLAVRPDEQEYGAYLNALHFGEATLTFPQTIVLRYGRLEQPEPRLPQAVTDYARWTLGRLAGSETLMAGAITSPRVGSLSLTFRSAMRSCWVGRWSTYLRSGRRRRFRATTAVSRGGRRSSALLVSRCWRGRRRRVRRCQAA